jgi:hypothetical protein
LLHDVCSGISPAAVGSRRQSSPSFFISVVAFG